MDAELVVDIEKSFPGGASVAADFRVTMRSGGITVLFGPSGSGKSTLVRCVAGLEQPLRGTIRFAGETWCDADRALFVPPQRRRLGYVFQEAALFPHLTVRGNTEYGLGRLSAAERATRVSDLFELLDLEALASRYPRQLSGGEAQRVALARALAPKPRLLLLDEPFAALDTPTRTRLRRLFRATVEHLRIASIVVTHDRTEAMALGDQLIVLAAGRIRQVGPVLEVFTRPADVAVARSVGVEAVVPAHVGRTEKGLMELHVGEATLRAVEVELEPHTREVFACIRAEDVTLARDGPAYPASARNHFLGRVLTIEPEGSVERVTIDCGFPLAALITRQAREEMVLAPGGEVVAAVKATAVHIVPRLL